VNTFEPVTQKAAGSVKWSALMEVVSRTASPIMFVILARLLTPEDFGVVSIAMIAISFSQMFWDAGLEKALIQTKEVPEKAADVVFWTNLVLGIVTYIILFLIAPWLATFFNSPASMPVLRVLGLQVVIASLTSVQQALFVRDLDFRQLFWVKLATAFVPGLFSIPMAFFGYGVWSLIAGSLVGSLLNLALLWRKSPWRPQLGFDWHIARKLFGFGIWVVGESLAAWFFTWGDSTILGRFLGVEDLGVYRVGWTISMIIFGLLLNPFLPVLYPTFSRLQDDIHKLTETFRKANRVVISLALPVGVGLLLVGPHLVSVFFGNKWHGLGLVVSMLGLAQGVSWLVAINPELYRAMGRADINTKLLFVAGLCYLPVYLFAAPHGLKVFLYARLGLVFVGISIHVFFAVLLLKVTPLYLWKEGKLLVLSTLVMATVVTGLKVGLTLGAEGLPDLVTLVILIMAGVVAYGGTLWLLDRPFVLQTKNLLRKVALT
jgi:O-antigen/teichoic acid export membrane protein